MKNALTILGACLVTVAWAACVNWHDGQGWHRPATGIEQYLAFRSYAPCRGIYPGVEVFSGRWSLPPSWAISPPRPDCLGDFGGAIEEARQAAQLLPGDLSGLRIFFSAERFKCGKDFHLTDHCTDGHDVVALWWTPHKSLKLAFADLQTARALGER